VSPWRNRIHGWGGRSVFALAHMLYFPSWMLWRLRRDGRRKLQLGSGGKRLTGWVNSDIDPRAEMIAIVGWPLPFARASLQRIYMEHVLEHVPYETAVRFLVEARRVLEPGGVIRIAVPDLEELCRGYQQDDWRQRFDWVKWPQFAFIQTRAQMLNMSFRWWGHSHLYDREEMIRAIREAGFLEFEFVERGASRHEDLRGLETRLDSTLVVEATNH
jgi:predicted SAM-dependent methyltransferase